MLCSKCGAENTDDSLFCNMCGSNFSHDVEQTNKPKRILNKRNIIYGCSFLIIGLAVVIGLMIFTNPVFAFKNDINNDQYQKAIKIYNQNIKGNSKNEKSANLLLKDKINKIEQSFENRKMDYNSAKEKLDNINSTSLVSDQVTNALDKINNLNNSRVSFLKAEEFLKNKDLFNALKEYNNVIKEDSNFETAQKKINEYKKQYKNQVLKNAEVSVGINDYEKAIGMLNDALTILPNDSEIEAKLSVYKEQQDAKIKADKIAEIEKAKADQLVIVQNATIIVQDSTYKALYPDMIQVFVKNISDKTIKNMIVGTLGFDSNGYPVKIKAQFHVLDGDYEYLGNAEDVNILPGQVFGQGKGWKLDENHGISKVLSCVKTVTFYDGTTWDNPYYQYWLDEYKEKPLH